MRHFQLIIRYAWVSPATAVGLLSSIIAMCAGATPRIVDGTIEVAGGHLHCLVSRLPPCARFAAITFGHVILAVDDAARLRCRAHERVHVAQYERWGALFLVLYPASSAIQWLRGRDPYYDNPFEREAFDARH